MVLDLFSGCGGLSLGFKTAGFKIAAHIDNDSKAYKSACLNINSEVEIDGCIDITEIDADHPAIKELNGKIDVIIGGPPCQAYSTVGRGKIASLSGFKNAHLIDDRGLLYLEFLKICDLLKPKAILIENVPAILSYGDEKIPEVICSELSLFGYRSAYTILNAASYGVPQYRDRLFILGLQKELDCDPIFPSPTHYIPEDKNIGKKRTANLIESGECEYAVMPDSCFSSLLPEAITTEAALDDLPFISTLNGSTWNFSMDKPLPYKYNSPSWFTKMMRNWPGLKPTEKVNANKCRNTPRDFPIFSKMEEGDNYPEALTISKKLFREKLDHFRSVYRRSPNDSELSKMKKEIVPPYDPSKFVDKWRKLERNSPAHTVVAHLSVDTYSHIHYDSRQARGITVREAARLQSFPDSFQFVGSLASTYKQIGNAVPPLLAFHLAKSIKECLNFSSTLE